MIEVIATLSARATMRRVNFLPLMTLVELIPGDGREYPRRSLPGIVAGLQPRITTALTLLDDMKYHNRERLLSVTPPETSHRSSPQRRTGRLLEADELVMNSYF